MDNFDNSVKLLAYLGSEQGTCPLHRSRTGTLHFLPGPALSGEFLVLCTDPRCRFQGSVIDLVAAARDCSLPEAMGAFLPGGPLHALFFPAYGGTNETENLRTEAMRCEDRRKVTAYLEASRIQLLNSSRVRSWFAAQGVKDGAVDGTGTGMAGGAEVPYRLAAAIPDRHLDTVIMLPYTSGGVVTDLVLIDTDDGSRQVKSLGMSAPGLFMEGVLDRPVTESVVVCRDEIDALVLRSKAEDVGMAGINPVSALDARALLQLHGLKRVTLLSSASRPLQPSSIMPYLRLRHLETRVLELGVLPVQLQPSGLRRVLNDAGNAWQWLVRTLNSVSATDGLEAVSRQIQALGLFQEDKTRILSEMAVCGIVNALLADEIRNARSTCAIQNFGKVQIRRTLAGYAQMAPVEKDLTDFIITLNYVTGDIADRVYSATVHTAGQGHPAYDILLREKDLVHKDGNRFYRLISNKLLEHGVKPGSFAADPVNIDWRNLIYMFDNPEFIRQTRLVGVDGDIVRLPGVRINLAAGSARSAEFLATLPAEVLSAYGSIGSGGRFSADMVRKICATSDRSLLTFMGLLGHVLVEVCRAAKGLRPKHLVIPYAAPDGGTESLVGQLNWMMGTTTAVPELTARPQVFFQNCTGFNRLPVLCMSRNQVPRLNERLNTAKSSLVMLYPSEAIRPGSAFSNSYFLAELGEQDYAAPASDVQDLLRACWPAMLKATYDVFDTVGAGMPAVSWLAHFGGVKSQDLFSQELAGQVSDDEAYHFFDLVRYLLESKKLELSDLVIRQQRNDYKGVMISSGRIVKRVREHFVRSRFDPGTITRWLVANRYCSLRKDRIWNISVEKWNNLTGCRELRFVGAEQLGLEKTS